MQIGGWQEGKNRRCNIRPKLEVGVAGTADERGPTRVGNRSGAPPEDATEGGSWKSIGRRSPRDSSRRKLEVEPEADPEDAIFDANRRLRLKGSWKTQGKAQAGS